MSWQWDQSAGALSLAGVFVSNGYSGRQRGYNNPKLEGVAGIGPIPAGLWRIMDRYDSDRVGPYVLTLFAQDGNLDDYHARTDRSAFRIHGDSVSAPGTASRGCIILPRRIRERMWTSGVRDLVVVA